ncbi:MAG: tyrosine-type recombinase/integrase [Oligoflexales bacterium]
MHFHSFRHTCLTNLANGYGMDTPSPLSQVQKIAGHRDIGTTMRMSTSTGSRILAAINGGKSH